MISNESGEGGAALTRRNFGETLARITESFPHWFAGNYRSFAERIASLPVDQHMLLSLIAPRALYVASADEDLWSDPRGEFLSLAYSSPVFALVGRPRDRAGRDAGARAADDFGAARVPHSSRPTQPDAVRLGSLRGLRRHTLEIACATF